MLIIVDVDYQLKIKANQNDIQTNCKDKKNWPLLCTVNIPLVVLIHI